MTVPPCGTWRSGRRGTERVAAVLALAILAAQALASTPAPRCETCGSAITGDYLRSAGHAYCSQACFQASLPRCDRCGTTMERWLTPKDGRRLCPSCYEQVRPRCHRCGDPLKSGVEILDRHYCPRCAAKPRCSACRLPEAGRRYPDGRHICNRCLATAVNEAQEAERLALLVRERLRNTYGLGTEHRILFQLVSANTLAQRSEEANGSELGLFRAETERTTRYQVRRDPRTGREQRTPVGVETKERRAIDILYGLPRGRFVGVVAHELAHDYARSNFPELPPKLAEGWAEYVAVLAESAFGYEEWNRIIEENDAPVHGAGYRLVRDLAADRGGLKGLIRYLEDYRAR